MSFKIHIKDRNYKEWDIYDLSSNILTKLEINPIDKKLLSGDIIDNNGNIISSTIRDVKNLAGILLLNGKTYGRTKKSNGKFYYKCIPNDKRLPAFIIPYELKNIGFNKNILNKYILFKFNNWNNKHPIGIVNNVIGDINELSAFYEYQLYCKDLVKPIKEFVNAVNNANKLFGDNLFYNIMRNNPSIEDRRNNYIISIDPQGSTDLDDAFGLSGNILSIYVANVPLLLDYFNLWSSFSERISTIYLPDRKCPMLPALLAENLCSLIQKQDRLAFCLDIKICENNIESIEFKNVIIHIDKNFVYNEADLLNDTMYQNVLNLCYNLNKKHKYMRDINDSHHLIAYLMLLMNSNSANKLNIYKTGIYRSIILKEVTNDISDSIPSDIYDFIKIWQSSSGHYTNYNENTGHQLINSGLDNYVHITSPIRRLVDLMNMVKLIEQLGYINISNNAINFYNYWENKLEYINITMRAIRKVQTDCNMLNLCFNNRNILDAIYDGYLFDMIERPHKLYQYTVYIPYIKMFTRVNISDMLPNYTYSKFKLYLIDDGVTLKKKIRAERYLDNN